MKRQTKIASFFAKPGEAARAPSTVLADKDSNLKPLQLKAQPNEICKITAPAIPAKKSAANVLLDSDIESETCTDPVDPPLSLSRKKAKTSSEDPDIADVIAAVVPKLSDTAQTDAKPISYDDLCQTFCKIEETTKRLQILAYLTDFFVRVIQRSPEILIDSVYLCLNRIGPEYEAKELGIGESLLMKAVALASGRSLKAIKADVDEKGDLGLVAQASKGNQKLMHKPKALTIRSVFLSLQEISNMSGNSSQSRKIALINKLLVSCTSNEPKYLIRSLEGKLRIGLAQQTILMALAHAVAITDPDFPKGKEKQVSVLAESVSIVKQVYSEMPSYDLIIPALLKYGWRALPDHCQLTPGIPLKPMLAHPTKSLTEVLNRFEGMEFTCEYKYDGERAQIHQLDDGRVMVYSRNSENLSDKYPDIIQRMAKALVTEPLSVRRELLLTHFKEIEGEFQFAKSMEGSSVEDIQVFLDESISGNCEGLMVKTLKKEASYEPSKRSRNWLKVKKDYVNGMGDSLDLVVIGGFVGRGKRTGVYGGYLLACYDEDREEYQSICKIGTGFSEEALAEQAKYFKPHIIDKPRPYYNYGDNPNVRPDVWFEPCVVWEVKAADLSISPVHKAAIGLLDPAKGISLRFPRFIRVRDDKSPEQATSSDQVAEFYRAQSINSGQGDQKDDDDCEY